MGNLRPLHQTFTVSRDGMSDAYSEQLPIPSAVERMNAVLDKVDALPWD